MLFLPPCGLARPDDSSNLPRLGLSLGFRVKIFLLEGRRILYNFNTIPMAIGPVRGKSWGGLHGWLPVAQTGL